MLLVQDMLDLIDLEGRREPGTYPTNQGGFDMIWNNGPVQQFERPTSLPTLLGCFNPRDQNQARKPLHAVLGSSQSPRFRKTRSTNGSSSGGGGGGPGCSSAVQAAGGSSDGVSRSDP